MFDRDRAKRIQDDMLRALKAVEDQHGVVFEIGRTAIGDTIQMSVECSRNLPPAGRSNSTTHSSPPGIGSTSTNNGAFAPAAAT